MRHFTETVGISNKTLQKRVLGETHFHKYTQCKKLKRQIIVGHVPQNLSKAKFKFLSLSNTSLRKEIEQQSSLREISVIILLTNQRRI